MKKQILTIRVSESLKNDLELLSETNGDSISDITRKALEAYVHNSTESEHASEEEEEQYLEDDMSFNFSKIISFLLDKNLNFKDSDIMDLFNDFNELIEDVKFDSNLKEAYLKEFRRAQKEADKVSQALLFYLDDLFILKRGISNFNFEDFSDFLNNLHSNVAEPHIVYLNIPQ